MFSHVSFLVLVHAALIRIGVVAAEELERIAARGGALPAHRAELSEVHNALAVSPLVVIPGNHLEHVVTHDHRERSVDRRAHIRLAEVNGDERLVRHREDAVELGRRGGAEGVVHLLRGRLLLNLNHEVDNGDVRRRHAERNAVELALHLREHLRHSLGRARGGGHDGERGGTRAAHVAVRRVEDALVARVRVRGRHRSLDDSELRVEHLDERREAVGRARGVGDDGSLRVEFVLGVDANDVRGDVVTLRRGGDEHLLGASLDVLARALGVKEHARSLNDEVDVHVLPRQLRRVAVGHNLDLISINRERLVVDDLDFRVERSEERVVLEQVHSRLDTARLVDSHDLEVRVVTARVQAAHEVASNAAEAVDRDAELHRGVCAAAVGGAERACGGDGASGRQHCYGVVGVGMRRGKGEGRGERGGTCTVCV
mmetsp:Transcript_11865/g.31436  ORF Transcript_11865/g.31436 Transcript_11865/m.31436 type:complete len:429 (+) Transcript_11865:82-1368(+)